MTSLPPSGSKEATEAMIRPRLTMASVMYAVVTAAAAAALLVRLGRHMPPIPQGPTLRYEIAALFVAAIVLTGAALAARKRHSPYLAMLQITVACLAFLILVSVAEVSTLRPVLYWYQASFAVLVVVPLVIRRVIKLRMQKGPRRAARMKLCEAIAFAFLNMALVLIGVLVQGMVAFAFMGGILKF